VDSQITALCRCAVSPAPLWLFAYLRGFASGADILCKSNGVGRCGARGHKELHRASNLSG